MELITEWYRRLALVEDAADRQAQAPTDLRERADNRRMSCTNPRSEFEALLHLSERLKRRFPGWDDDALFALIADELEAFDSARLREYVPVLIEHNVRQRLQATHEPAASRGRRGAHDRVHR
ncbi:three-helix bundle dimerization domain-containing protein [uncultured Microbacterium sp.]|uniref:three-helix bundle dimerization domain-containing protein n=1 Tax=uncultured Microbacterium sp. TaxID=191216 RepID=UPI0035C96927